MDLRDPRGKRYQIGEPVGKGGEASVHRIAGQPRWLAKIYAAPTPDREAKLAWMVAHPPDDPAAAMGHTSISWPVQLLYTDRGFAGFLMPHIQDAVKILDVYHPRRRLQTFQRFTQKHLHNTAYNLAAAVGAIHQRGYVVGDLSESNVLVARSTLVTLIDTDSFQVRAGPPEAPERLHYCIVGKPEYLPPEMQDKDLLTTERHPEHDRFSLAVLIFQLLMDGSHPFRGRWTAAGEKPGVPERIRKGYYPYRSMTQKFVQPIDDLHRLHPLIVDLFQRCFILGHLTPEARPSPAAWEAGLAEVVKTLVPCRQGHYHSPHLDRCPECQRAPLPRRPPPPGAQTATRPEPAAPAPVPPAQPPVRPAPSAAPATIAPGAVVRTLAGIPQRVQRRLRSWLQRNPPRTWARQPGIWALAGMLAGSLLGTQLPAVAVGRLMGLMGGLASGALAGDVVEKKIGWQAFFAGFGVLSGLLVWYWFGGSEVLASWILAGGLGGAAGMLLGRYGRFTELTVLWAACGAGLGWFLGQWLAGLAPQGWLAAGLSGGTASLVTGAAYALWRKYG